MKKRISVLITFFCASFCFAAESKLLLDSANTAYARNDFAKAITNYETILKGGEEAPEVYYNLGNAYFKANNIAKAILNYERAKKLAPNDEDIITNLKLANQKTKDKIEALPTIFLNEWKNGFLSIYTATGWAIFCIVSFIVCLLLLSVYFLSPKLALRQAGFWMALLVMCISITTFFIARHQHGLATNKTEAIIIEASVTAKGSPTDKGTRLFILHEGAKVNITGTEANWVEVKLSNGSVGWVLKKSLELI